MNWWVHGDVISGRIKDDDSTKDGQKDINYYNRAGSQIMEEIKTFATNRLSLTHSSHTNVITLTANWPRENLRPMVSRILRLRDVDGVFTFPNYIEELKEAREIHDFLSGSLFFYITRVLNKHTTCYYMLLHNQSPTNKNTSSIKIPQETQETHVVLFHLPLKNLILL